MRASGRRLAAMMLLACAIAACRTTPTLTPARATDAERAARRAIANERALDSVALSPRTVGITPLYVAGDDSLVAPLAYGLADLLGTDLARSARIRVVDRLHMDALLRELAAAGAGIVDSASAPRVGRLTGAGRLVVGGIAGRADSTLRIDARVADVATSALRDPVTATTALERILDAEKALAFRLFAALEVELTPAERALVEQRPTRNVAAFLAYSRAVRDEALARYDDARREYREALRLDPGFSAARQRVAELGDGARAADVGTTGQLRRAALAASDAVNPALFARTSAGSPADPSFGGSRLVTIIINVTSRP